MDANIFINVDSNNEIKNVQLSVNSNGLTQKDLIIQVMYLKRKYKVSENNIFCRLSNGDLQVFDTYNINFGE